MLFRRTRIEDRCDCILADPNLDARVAPTHRNPERFLLAFPRLDDNAPSLYGFFHAASMEENTGKWYTDPMRLIGAIVDRLLEVLPVQPVQKLWTTKREKDETQQETPDEHRRRANKQLLDDMVSDYTYSTKTIRDSRERLMARTQEQFSRLRKDPQFDEGQRYEIERIFDRWVILHATRMQAEAILTQSDDPPQEV